MPFRTPVQNRPELELWGGALHPRTADMRGPGRVSGTMAATELKLGVVHGLGMHPWQVQNRGRGSKRPLVACENRP